MSQQINLYNPLLRKQGFKLLSATTMLYAFAIAVGVAALVAVYQEQQLRDVQARAQAVERAHREASANGDKLVAEIAKQQPNAQLAAEIAALDTQLSERQEVMAALKDGVVGNTDGFSTYMRAFSRQSISGLWLTGFDIALSGTALALRGRTLSAEHVAEYLNRLNQEKSMQGRQFAAMRISQPPAPATVPAQVAAPAPVATPAPSSATANPPAKSAAGANDITARVPAPPRYLDFMISTQDIAEGPQGAMAPAAVPPPLLGPLSSSAPAGQAGSP